MKKEKINLERTLFIIIIGTGIVLSLVCFAIGVVLTEEFVLKYSPDGKLAESTLQKISYLRASLFFLNISSLLATFVIMLYWNRIVHFIVKKKELIINLLILILIIIIPLIIGEIVLRIVYYEHTSRDGASPGTLTFNKKYFSLNNEGMRDYNFTIEKKLGTTRIVGLGDSFTAGWGVKNVNETYLKRLELLLNKDTTLEIYNFGVGGYGTDDEINTLNEKALRYHPDLVIVGYMLNDFKNVDPNITEPRYSRISLPFLGFWLRSSSYLYHFAESRINNLLYRITADKTHDEYVSEVLDSEMNREYNANYFRQMKNISDERNITFIIVIFPIYQDIQNYKFKNVHEFISENAKGQGFYVLDLLPYYTNYTDKDLIVNNDDRHPNEFAHKIAAREIFEMIKSNAILDKVAQATKQSK